MVVHQTPPTAKGHHFLTLEDETGLLDVVVRPRVYAQHRQLLHHAAILLAQGVLQRDGERLSVLAKAFTDIGEPISPAERSQH